jgi:hypothetical protein
MVDRNQGSTKLQHRAAALALNMCRFLLCMPLLPPPSLLLQG